MLTELRGWIPMIRTQVIMAIKSIKKIMVKTMTELRGWTTVR